MRLIFFLLMTINLALLAWRLVVGLPEGYSPATDTAVAQLQMGGKQLRLLGETQPQGDPAAASSPVLCKMAGPFANPEEAGTFQQRLAALDVSAWITTIKRPSGEGYWVHFPPDQNVAKAKKRLAQLQERGIDSYIIAEGELKNSISVGLFGARAAAEARVAELASLGYDTSVHAIDRFSDEIWVVLPEGEDQKIAASAWKRLVNDNFSVTEQEKPCLDVASH